MAAQPKTTWKTMKRLVHEARKYWIAAGIGIFATVLQSSFDALFNWLVKIIIDKGFVERDMVFIKWLPALFIGIFLLRGTSNFASTYSLTRVARSVVMNFRRKLFQKFLRLPAKYYDNNSSGHLLSTVIYNVEQVANATAITFLKILRDGWYLIGLVVVMFTLNWRIALIICCAGPFLATLLRYTSKKLRRYSTRVQDTVGKVTHIADEGIQGYKVIRIFGGQKYESRKFHQVTHENRHQEMKVAVTNNLGTIFTQLLVAVPLSLTIYVATMPSMHMSAGSFAAIFATMVMMLTPLRRLTTLNSDIQKGVAGADSIFDVLDQPEEQNTGSKVVTRVRGAIEYRHVSFRYNEEQAAILHDISLTIKPGETIAIVGHSGAGKSTLVNLLPRFYEACSGQILLDGEDINHYQLENLRDQFAIVSQHTTLFDDTIANNIAYAMTDKNISRTDIENAAKAAHALQFIQALPQGLDSKVGDNGVLLSGGQRQRIAIARAILKNAPILILDEATSSLDTESERAIQAAMENLMLNRTTLVIAHRLSTIENANRIIVMDKGHIVESGTHHQLLEHNGVYARLHRLQFQKQLEMV